MSEFDTNPSQTPRAGRPPAPGDTPRARIGLTRSGRDDGAADRHDLHHLLIW